MSKPKDHIDTTQNAAGAVGIAPPPSAIVVLEDVDELAKVEDALLERQLEGTDAVEAYLYAFPEKDRNRQPTGRYVVGATADFVVQMVRMLNRATKGKIDLRLLPVPPVVTDFSIPDERTGAVRPYVRVTVGVTDAVTGEPSFGIKELPRHGIDPVGACHTRAIRRAFELHPSYDRKRVSRFIREKLKALGLDPQRFLIAGAAGGGEWAQFFAQARAKGVSADALRAGVREKTGKGLSQVSSPTDAAKAAQAATETIQETPNATPGQDDAQGKPHPGVEGARQPLSSDAGPAGDPRPASPPETPSPPASSPTSSTQPTDPLTELRDVCSEYARKMGLLEKDGSQGPTLKKIWKDIGSPQATFEDFKRLFIVLSRVSTGETAQTATAEALTAYPKDATAPVPTA